ncbi:unnamed protein product [Prorocentrum cordatum]|uniref:Uncharacterized protein n=1 Tax=Prorocentrum cordatum TaxID=2364126 RepID=A0ABN9U7H0_9DINO|nr:unnamed protein product [Polarella glacialis]
MASKGQLQHAQKGLRLESRQDIGEMDVHTQLREMQGHGEKVGLDHEEGERVVPFTALNSAARPYAPERSNQMLGSSIAEFGAEVGETFFEEGSGAHGNCSQFLQGGGFVQEGAVANQEAGDSVDGEMDDQDGLGDDSAVRAAELRRLLLGARARVDAAAVAVVLAGAGAGQAQLELEAAADRVVEIEGRLASAEPVEPRADACRGRPPPGPWATGFVYGELEESSNAVLFVLGGPDDDVRSAATAELLTAADQRSADLTELFAALGADTRGSGGEAPGGR